MTTFFSSLSLSQGCKMHGSLHETGEKKLCLGFIMFGVSLKCMGHSMKQEKREFV